MSPESLDPDAASTVVSDNHHPMGLREDFGWSGSATLQRGLDASWQRFAQKIAIQVDGVSLTYADMGRRALAGAEAVADYAGASPFVIVFGHRSMAAFVGIVSTLKAGKAYLPVSHKFPPDRLLEIFQISESDTLFLSKELTDHFRRLLDAHADSLPTLNVLYLADDHTAISPLIKDFPRHRFVPVGSIVGESSDDFRTATCSDFAYMLFTSGSTGKPKGIAITHENVCSYVATMLESYDFRSDDRFSQCFDLTFDYSVHDMFCCWLSGACLCVIPPGSLIAPAKFIEKSGITVWFSVPSLAMTMDKMRMLRPDRFEDIRLSFFGGEAVSERIVETWQAAAPNSVVHNVYGPTEATINISHYRWEPATSPGECTNGGVPLGESLSGLEVRIVDPSGSEVAPGEKGELVVSGPQVARGYYKNTAKTAQAFRALPGDPRIWYWTGDLTSRDSDGVIRYFGRMDFQVQICGHRVELAEIESLLRKAAQSEYAVAIPWPYAPETGRADSVVAVVGGSEQVEYVEAEIDRLCQDRLPAYAIPSQIVSMDEFPLNINGKIDRKAIAKQLGEMLS